jgi:hypothetical protein
VANHPGLVSLESIIPRLRDRRCAWLGEWHYSVFAVSIWNCLTWIEQTIVDVREREGHRGSPGHPGTHEPVDDTRSSSVAMVQGAG